MRTDSEVTESGTRKALVISAAEENRAALSAVLAPAGIVLTQCSSIAEARQHIRGDAFNVVFCDDCLPDGDLAVVVHEVDRLRNPIPVIAMSRTGEWDEFLEALRIGAFDYLALPPRRDEVERVLASALSISRPDNKVQVQAGL